MVTVKLYLIYLFIYITSNGQLLHFLDFKLLRFTGGSSQLSDCMVFEEHIWIAFALCKFTGEERFFLFICLFVFFVLDWARTIKSFT